MSSHKSPGFTLIELMVSLAILSLISLSTVFGLQSSRQHEELDTAARLLQGDFRNVEARALAAQNVLTCPTAAGNRVCEPENSSGVTCTGTCVGAPPTKFGIKLQTGQEGYDIFAEVEPATDDWRYTNTKELVQHRSLNPLGGGKVTVTNLQTDQGTLTSSNVAVGRQNGAVRIDACGDPGLPVCGTPEAKVLRITLTHTESAQTATVEVNAVTGRVSIY